MKNILKFVSCLQSVGLYLLKGKHGIHAPRMPSRYAELPVTWYRKQYWAVKE